MRLRSWALAATVSTFVLILLGAYVVKTGAGLSCVSESWPFCNGRVLPPFESPKDDEGNELFTQAQMTSEWLHRAFAGLTSVLTVAVLVVARLQRVPVRTLALAIAAVGLLFAQVLMGALTVKLGNAPWTVVVHQGLAMSFFGILVALLVLSWNFAPSPRPTSAAAVGDARAPPSLAKATAVDRLADYVSLLKPRVLLLLLVATVASMLIASGTRLDPSIVFATLLGGAMASGAASAFNQWWEADLDAMMARTARRPVAAGRLPGHHVLAFSASLAVGSFMVLAVFVNLLAAALAFAGGLFYVLVYTIWLKRQGPSNIVIGGAAGSFPALVGWAAATGEIAWPALILGFIIFLWTPPHFWAFALVYKEDYARAHIPMLPVVRGDHNTKQQIFLYSIALFLCATSLWFFDVVSDVYFVVSMLLSTLFVVFAFLTLRDPGTRSALRLFRYSILYLGLLFLSMAVDRILFLPTPA